MNRIYGLLTALIAALPSITANAAIISTLYSTGVDNAGNPLPHAAAEQHYSLIQVPGGTTSLQVLRASGDFPVSPGVWLGDNSESAWIGPATAEAVGPVGNYVFRTTFDLTGFDPKTASISGLWSTDNQGLDIRVNGVSTGQMTPFFVQYLAFTPFSISNGFVSGINTLDFVVNNGDVFPNPIGVRVQIESATADVQATAVPEATTITLWSLGALGCAIGAYRRRRAA